VRFVNICPSSAKIGPQIRKFMDKDFQNCPQIRKFVDIDFTNLGLKSANLRTPPLKSFPGPVQDLEVVLRQSDARTRRRRIRLNGGGNKDDTEDHEERGSSLWVGDMVPARTLVKTYNPHQKRC